MKVLKHGWFALFVVILVLSQRHVLAQSNRPQQLSATAQAFLASLPDEWLRNEANYWVAGELLVGRDANAQDVQAAAFSTQLGFQPEAVQGLTIDSPNSGTPLRIERWLVPAGTEWKTIAFLREQPSILFAEPNWVVNAAEEDGFVAPGTVPTATPTPSATKNATKISTATATFTASRTPVSTPNLSQTPVAAPTAIDTTLILQPQPYVPNDPLYIDKQWYLQRINAARALALLDEGNGSIQASSDVVVGVIDSGMDLTHPEFKGRILPGFNFWSNSGDPNVETCELPTGAIEPVFDDFGHGTHVAGLIGASLNNQMGIGSVAPFVKFQPLKILNGNGSGTVFDLATALTYAANCLDVKIINLSLEISASVLDNNPLFNNTLHTAIQLAYARNILLIAAGGNSGGTIVPYPAAYAEVMGVAALNVHNQKASYSTKGSQIDLAAPGGESTASLETRIYSTWSKDAVGRCRDGSYQELNGGSYCNDHGTSMATPLVVGAAALVWSVQPALNANQVRDILLESATPLGLPAEQVGRGRLDVHAALRRVLPSAVVLARSEYYVQAAQNTSSLELPIRLENPSSQPLSWQGQVVSGTQWISLASTGQKLLTGTVQYGQPAFFPILLTPAQLSLGEHSGQVVIVSNDSAGSPMSTTVTIRVLVSTNLQQATVDAYAIDLQTGAEITASRRHWIVGSEGQISAESGGSDATIVYYFPLLRDDTQVAATETPTPMPTPTQVLNSPAAVLPTPVAIPFRWETPTVASARSLLALSPQTPVSITLPVAFAFPMRGQSYSDLRVFEDGYVVFSANELEATQESHCLPDLPPPNQAIFGWWTDLDATAVGSQISTFPNGADQFVIEFNNVPALGTSPTYTVSFQIVLHNNGDIGLNYLHVPLSEGKPASLTIGAKAREGLFSFQLVCSTASEDFGEPPRSGQSFLIKAEYLY